MSLHVYVGQTRSKKLIESLSEAGVGEVTQRGELPPRRRPWFYDNGAFRDWKGGKQFGTAAFEADLAKIEAEQLRPDFIILPDIVAAGHTSYKKSIKWIAKSAPIAPLYLAVQDNLCTSHFSQDVISRLAGIFVGGTKSWKMQTSPTWCAFAHNHGLKVHIGRCGTIKRVLWARRIGADSIDSSLPLWSRHNLSRFLWACFSPDLQPELPRTSLDWLPSGNIHT